MLIDSHCHLPDEKYTKSLDVLINEAAETGVTKLINIGTSFQENVNTLEVSAKFPNVYSALAIYPHADQDKSLETQQKELAAQLKSSPKVVAVGECGIDITGNEGERTVADQITLLEMQLQLAIDHKLPVVIHNRGGDEIIFAVLDKFIALGLKGVAHCFSSPQKVADMYLSRGFYISLSGMLTYPAKADLRETVKHIPSDRILFETDSPYLPPQGFRGQINEPIHIIEVAKKYSEIMQMPFDKVAEVTYSNTCSLFGLPQA